MAACDGVGWAPASARFDRFLRLLLFTNDGKMGSIARVHSGEEIALGADTHSLPAADWPFSPCLEPGLGILWALSQSVERARFEIREPGRSTFFSWNAI